MAPRASDPQQRPAPSSPSTATVHGGRTGSAEAPPDVAFVEDVPVHLGGDTAALGWALGPAGAPPVVGRIDTVTGTVTVTVTVTDGLISSMRTLLVG